MKGEWVYFWECWICREVGAVFPGSGAKHPKCFQLPGDVAAGQAVQPWSPKLGQAHRPGQDTCFLPTPRTTVETEHIKQGETP